MITQAPGAELAVQAIMGCAAVILGMTGFGNAVVAVPLLLLVVDDPKLVIPVVTLVSLVASLFMLTAYRFPVDRTLLGRLAMPATLGTLAGTCLLRFGSPDLLGRLVHIVIIGFAVASLAGKRPRPAHQARLAPAVGFVAGLLGSSVGTPGPPVVLYLHQEHTGDPRLFRGTILLFFGVVGGLTLLAYLVAGVMTREHLALAARLCPVTLAGIWAGMRVFARFSGEGFRRAVLLCLIAVSLVPALLR